MKIYTRNILLLVTLTLSHKHINTSALLKATSNNDITKTQQILANYQHTTEEKNAALFQAIENKNINLVMLLLSNGAELQAKYSKYFECSPLHIAVAHGCKDIAQLLINCKADLNIKDKNDFSPLDVALYSLNESLLQHYCMFGKHIGKKHIIELIQISKILINNENINISSIDDIEKILLEILVIMLCDPSVDTNYTKSFQDKIIKTSSIMDLHHTGKKQEAIQELQKHLNLNNYIIEILSDTPASSSKNIKNQHNKLIKILSLMELTFKQ